MASICLECGSPLRENDKFCRKCGAPVRTMTPAGFDSPSVKKGELSLSLSELLEGCRKVVDFGTGKKYELSIPAGLSPGDTVAVESESLIDSDTGKPCRIELSIRMS